MNTQNYSEQEWQTLHEEIQRRFRGLAVEVADVAPASVPEYGKTVTKRFPLFSHVSFGVVRDGVHRDIIIGMDIAPENGEWRVDADVMDEEEGTVFFELPQTPFVVASFEELKDRVLRLTEQLVNGAKPVLLGLLGSPAPVLTNQATNFPQVASKV